MGASTRAPGGSSANDQARRVMGLLINDMVERISDPLVLVSDDLHAVTEPAALDALTYLIERIPPQLHLVIATRNDPQLPLARLAARRQLAELRRAQLGFTRVEAEQLLDAAFDVCLANEDLDSLLARTEGWAVGLCLFATTLQRMERAADRSTFIAKMAGSDRYVFQFLAEEVLERQEPKIQRILLQTSILNELTPALCRAVTGLAHAADILDRLYHENLFIVSMNEHNGPSGRYRYHALFSDFLQKKLAAVMPDQVNELHRRAAEAHPSSTRSIAHYLAAGLWDRAASQMETVGPELLIHGLLDTVRAWCHALPQGLLEERPPLLALLGRCEMQRGDLSAARDALTRARSGFARLRDAEGESAATTTLLSAVFLQGDWEAMQGLVEAAKFMALGPLGQIQTLLPQTWLHMLHGESDRAAESLQRALQVARNSADPTGRNIVAFHLGPLFATLPGCLGPVEQFCREEGGADSLPRALGIAETATFLHLWRGDAEAAMAQGNEALALRQRLSGYTWLGLYAAVWLSIIHTLRRDLTTARQHADWIMAQYKNAPTIQHATWLYGAGRAYWQVGETGRAQEVLRRMHLGEQRETLPQGPILREALTGLIAFSQGHHAEAETLLRRVCVDEQRVPGSWIAGTCRVPLARLLYDRGSLDEAWKEIAPALEVCARDRTPGFVVQWGEFAIPILQLCVARGDETGMAAHALGLLGASTVQPVLAEPLSNRELDVLRLLANGVSNREIAQALFIGDETVKSHVARILRKLDAHNRTQPVSIAQRLGLVHLGT